MSTTTGNSTGTSTNGSVAAPTSTPTTLVADSPSRFRQLTAPRSRVIRDWDPEDTAAWEAGNKKVARRNLVWSVATEHVGFSIWSIWSVMVLFMPQAVYGFTAADKFFLVAVPTLVVCGPLLARLVEAAVVAAAERSKELGALFGASAGATRG